MMKRKITLNAMEKISNQEMEALEEGLADIESGRVVDHSIARLRYAKYLDTTEQ